ncbi:UNVERIFIED_CONTAM: putative (S)-N-methylcoclaurine 3'-hydroxylase isozyme 2 [Sesamum radiatum]|uniref:(S)-N-methylcoclaurine 3'-hydroxylase isozyme 2 n=1 Tax=Sesamum radiatum TaxID=300843 RepID=A0AAW2THP6_SESRA
MIQLAGLLSLLVVFLPLLFFLKHLIFEASARAKLPPGPNAWQVLLNISQLRNKPHVAFHNLAKIYGPLFSMRLGGQLLVVASSPATAKAIFRTHDRVFSGRYLPSLCYAIPATLQSYIMRSTSQECNGVFECANCIIIDLFSSLREVESKSKVRKERVLREMMDYLVEKEGEVVKLDDVLKSTLCNMFANVVASRNLVGCGSWGNGKMVKDLVDEIGEIITTPALADLFPVLRRVDFWRKRDGKILQRKVMCLWGDILKERRSRNGSADNARDFLDVLLENAFPDDLICFILMGLLIAGGESGLITTIWVMVELMRNQDTLSRVRQEIAKAMGTETAMINDSILSTCEYFQACVKETLRLHAPGPLLVPHQALENCVLNDYTIPKDSIVLVNAWAIQLDPENWKDATSFKPDRFLGSKVDFRGNHFEFIPFGSGRRMCPGLQIGFRNVQLLVACLIHYFDWSLPDGENPKNLDTANVSRAGGLRRVKPLLMIPRLREKYVV